MQEDWFKDSWNYIKTNFSGVVETADNILVRIIPDLYDSISCEVFDVCYDFEDWQKITC